MGKRTKARQWLVFAEYYGGPCDGENLELMVSGLDPVRAFVAHVEQDDIPERIKKDGHWYRVEWRSLFEFSCGHDNSECAASVIWVHEGVDQ